MLGCHPKCCGESPLTHMTYHRFTITGLDCGNNILVSSGIAQVLGLLIATTPTPCSLTSPWSSHITLCLPNLGYYHTSLASTTCLASLKQPFLNVPERAIEWSGGQLNDKAVFFADFHLELMGKSYPRIYCASQC